jgi:hypothetical protein
VIAALCEVPDDIFAIVEAMHAKGTNSPGSFTFSHRAAMILSDNPRNQKLQGVATTSNHIRWNLASIFHLSF